MSEGFNVSMNGSVPDRGPVVFAVTTATLVLASILVGARITCRYFVVRNVTWDDKVMVLAWVVAFFLSFTIDLGVANGLGKHDRDISRDAWTTLRSCEYVFSILYNPALAATKTSILILYLRLAKRTQVVLRYASWATLVIVNVAGAVLTLMNVFQCSPLRAAWAVDVDEGAVCIPLLTEFICSAPVNILTDLAILALPIPILTRLHLPRRQKTILVSTFALGIFVTVVDVVRIYYLQKAIGDVANSGSLARPGPEFGVQSGFAWNASLSIMWSAVEVNIGMACACVPTIKPLVIKLLPHMLDDPVATQTSCVRTRLSESSTPSSRSQPSATGILPSTDENVYQGFIDVTKPRSMLSTSVAESFKFCLVVSILFFLWGGTYGLLNNLNTAIAALNHMSTAQTLGLTCAYLGGGYFFGPLLVGQWILRRDELRRSQRHPTDANGIGGFKVTFIVGLCIYGVGTIIFWPSAITNSYGGFLLSSFVVGFGLAVLEVAANSFMILCGPPHYGEARLLLAQGVQGVGSITGGLLAQKVFFRGLGQHATTNSRTLINIQWTYLGITLLCVLLSLLFFYLPLPEVSDHELEQSMSHLPVNPRTKSIAGLQLRTVSLILAVFAQYMYVGAQEINVVYFRSLLTSTLPTQDTPGAADNGSHQSPNTGNSDMPLGFAISTSDYLVIGHAAFTTSRFLPFH
ncbi:L-fucose permease [Purpureocillium lavendulum]|uniref:L-fucose permease n=1 Tax=Purpureocillium lavendulum TaxID=1247861 RepID=A0AB34FF06_9HYPO|nr:L-fucose permease [Purpureocillium lavendulum]